MKKLEKILKLVTMNRPAFLGYSLLAGGLVGGIYSVLERDMTSLASSCSSILGGAFILSGTDFGNETYRVYERTKEHIQKYKRLDEEVVKLYSKFYCERQGVYMAAKELGHLDEYKNFMKSKKSIIPNF
jgi:hypothetical protein